MRNYGFVLQGTGVGIAISGTVYQNPLLPLFPIAAIVAFIGFLMVVIAS